MTLPIVESAPRLRLRRRESTRRLLREWLVAFSTRRIVARRGIPRAVIGLSGGVDSAVTAFLVRARTRSGKRLRDSHAVSDLAPVEP